MSMSYNIEDNIDFYEELYKSLDSDDNVYDENNCLITNETLTNNFIKLECGHKFNYIPLYNDIKNHKQKFNGLEDHINQLKIDEIRCPYCRHKQIGLLPYYEEIGLPKLHGVNCIDPNMKNKMIHSCNKFNYKKCQYLKINPLYDPSGNNPCETNPENIGNCKYFTCNHYGAYKTSKIEGYIEENILVCFFHKKYIIKQHNQSIRNKKKEEEKKLKIELKIKEKEDKLKAKEEAKLKAKEEKLKLKEEAKLKAKEEKLKVKEDKLKVNTNILNINANNVIISENIEIGVLNDNQCIKILKNGPNKGKPCGCKIFESLYCKRHMENTYINKM
jgi:hypothetical protein